MSVRNRILGHRQVRAGELVPHELNPRTHGQTQRKALADLYQEVGFARSLLAYELPDGRLKLIDGHLRREMDPNEVVTVEVLDVNDEEARKLLLCIDPLSALAGYEQDAVDQLRSVTATDSAALANLWAAVAEAQDKALAVLEKAQEPPPAQPAEVATGPAKRWLVQVECLSQQHQRDVLRWLEEKGLPCKPLREN